MLYYALLLAVKQQLFPNSVQLSMASIEENPNQHEPGISPNVETFFNIMKYLEVTDSLKLLRVCKVWSSIAAEAFYRSPPYGSQLHTLLHAENSYHPYDLFIRELSFSGKSGMKSQDLLMGDLGDLLEHCPNVISLRLDSYWNLSNLIPTLICEHLPFLARIELPGCQIGDAFVLQLIRKVYTLRHIDVSYTNVSLSTLPIIIRECLYLETLDMTGTKRCDEKMVADYETSEYILVGDALKKFKSFISQLSLSNTFVNDDMIAYVAKHCPSLERILLNNCPSITDSSIYAIAMHCTRLKELDLGFCPKLTDIGIQSLAVHFSSHAKLLQQNSKPKKRVQSLSALDSPNIRNCMSYTDYTDYQPVLKMHVNARLESIILTDMTKLSYSSICLLASKCPKLNRIVLDGCDSVIEWYSPSRPNSVNSSTTVDDSFLGEIRYQEMTMLELSRNQILNRAGELDLIKR